VKVASLDYIRFGDGSECGNMASEQGRLTAARFAPKAK
jgi:hypothetical protein